MRAGAVIGSHAQSAKRWPRVSSAAAQVGPEAVGRRIGSPRPLQAGLVPPVSSMPLSLMRMLSLPPPPPSMRPGSRLTSRLQPATAIAKNKKRRTLTGVVRRREAGEAIRRLLREAPVRVAAEIALQRRASLGGATVLALELGHRVERALRLRRAREVAAHDLVGVDGVGVAPLDQERLGVDGARLGGDVALEVEQRLERGARASPALPRAERAPRAREAQRPRRPSGGAARRRRRRRGRRRCRRLGGRRRHGLRRGDGPAASTTAAAVAMADHEALAAAHPHGAALRPHAVESTVNLVPTTSTMKRGVRTSKCWPGRCATSTVSDPASQLDDAPSRRQTSSVAGASAVVASASRTSPPAIGADAHGVPRGRRSGRAPEPAATVTSPATTRTSVGGWRRRSESRRPPPSPAPRRAASGQASRRAVAGACARPASAARRTRSRAAETERPARRRAARASSPAPARAPRCSGRTSPGAPPARGARAAVA